MATQELYICGLQSTGKSTLANCLIGRYVLPVMVQASGHKHLRIQRGDEDTLVATSSTTLAPKALLLPDETIRQDISQAIAQPGQPLQTTLQFHKRELPLFSWAWWRALFTGQPRYTFALDRPTPLCDSIIEMAANRPRSEAPRAPNHHLPTNRRLMLVFSAEETNIRREEEFAKKTLSWWHEQGCDAQSVITVMNKADIFLTDEDPTAETNRRRLSLDALLAANSPTSWTLPPSIPVSGWLALCGEHAKTNLYRASQTTGRSQERTLRDLDTALGQACAQIDLPRNPTRWEHTHILAATKLARQTSNINALADALLFRQAQR